jgi:hypothetical protein
MQPFLTHDGAPPGFCITQHATCLPCFKQILQVLLCATIARLCGIVIERKIKQSTQLCQLLSRHSALERFRLLAASAALTALTPLLSLESSLPSIILIILVSLDVVTTCTRVSLIVGPCRRYLGRLRILAAPADGRLRSSYWHLICAIAICSLLCLPPRLLIIFIIIFRRARSGSTLLAPSASAADSHRLQSLISRRCS